MAPVVIFLFSAVITTAVLIYLPEAPVVNPAQALSLPMFVSTNIRSQNITVNQGILFVVGLMKAVPQELVVVTASVKPNIVLINQIWSLIIFGIPAQ